MTSPNESSPRIDVNPHDPSSAPAELAASYRRRG